MRVMYERLRAAEKEDEAEEGLLAGPAEARRLQDSLAWPGETWR